MFDPQAFLNSSIDQANSTQLVPIPDGEYVAVVDSVDIKPWQSSKDPSMSGLKASLVWTLDDAGVKEQLGRDKVTVRQDIMLDLTEGGTLDVGKGKNVRLGQLREALNLNQPGKAFNFNMLKGQVAKVKVTQRVDGENIYNDVKSVARMS